MAFKATKKFNQNLDLQQESTKLFQVEQPRLELPLKRDSGVTITEQMLDNVKDFHGAIKKCVALAPCDPKVIPMELEIDKAQWSRILSGQANFPPSKINQLMDSCGNRFPLLWLARSEGFGLVRLKSEVEMENERLRMLLEQKDNDLNVIKNFLKDVKGAA